VCYLPEQLQAGSYALAGAKYRYESTVVAKLRTVGAIILGKTNLSQWGMARSPKCPSGWSATFGQAYGPFHANQDPQGSSSGSAIAASLRYAAGCLGAEVSFSGSDYGWSSLKTNETCGSILYPAQSNSVVGLKPTTGLTSRAGTIPLNPDQDSIGPLALSVKDVAILLQIIAGALLFVIRRNAATKVSQTKMKGMKLRVISPSIPSQTMLLLVTRWDLKDYALP
jgi:amidase